MTKEELKKMRLDIPCNQSYAAYLVGVSIRTWQRWESGKTKINQGLSELFVLKIKNMTMK